MMRKRVSRNVRIGRFLIYPYIFILVYVNLDQFIISDDKLDNVSIIMAPAISMLLLVIGYLLYKYLDKTNTIEYDDSYLYISNKSGIDIVPLENILSLKMTTAIKLNNHLGWKITYKNNNNEECIVKFFPRLLNINLQDFSTIILTKNEHLVYCTTRSGVVFIAEVCFL